MARIIVNEGAGPRPVDLTVSRLVIGGSPDCDVRLKDPAAAGTELVLEATPNGHRVVRLRGKLLLNEEPCEVADLLHNDTLHVGESLVLYKNPDARRAEPPAARATEPPRAAPAPEPEPAAEQPLAELPELEELQELEELHELEELKDLDELEELEELDELEAIEPVEATAEARPSSVEPPRVEPAAEPAPAPLAPERAAHVVEPAPVEPAPEPMPPAAEEVQADEELVDLLAIEDPRALPDEPSMAPSQHAPAPAIAAPPRAAPSGPVRFRRPLPPGCKAPTSPPPASPGRPPR